MSFLLVAGLQHQVHAGLLDMGDQLLEFRYQQSFFNLARGHEGRKVLKLIGSEDRDFNIRGPRARAI